MKKVKKKAAKATKKRGSGAKRACSTCGKKGHNARGHDNWVARNE